MNLRSLNLVLFLCFLIHLNLYGQEFSSIELGVSYLHFELLDNSYESRWTVDNAITISGRTPFYLGELGLDFSFYEYEPVSEVSKYSTLSFSSGLFYPIKLSNTFFLVGGVSTGIERIRDLASSEERDFKVRESELFYAISVEPTLRLNNVIIFLEAEYRKVFFYERLHNLTYGIGLRYNLQLPQKVIEFIR